MTKSKKLYFYVHEDHGGGLSLTVYECDNLEVPVYHHSCYEVVPGQLSSDIRTLLAADIDITEWDGNTLDHVATAEERLALARRINAENDEDSNRLILIRDDEGLSINFMGMGAAARIEFAFVADAHLIGLYK